MSLKGQHAAPWRQPGAMLLLALGLAVLPGWGRAQAYVLDEVQQGTIITYDGDTLQGPFSINLPTDLLQLNQNNTIKTLSARQVERFQFGDATNGTQRLFLSLPFTTGTGYRIPMFFELLLDGHHMALLLRETLVVESMPVYDSFSNRTLLGTRTRVQKEFFFMDAKGKITRYSGRKKELFSIFAQRSDALKQFVKDQKLDHNSQADLVRITDYYNSLMAPKHEQHTPPDTGQ